VESLTDAFTAQIRSDGAALNIIGVEWSYSEKISSDIGRMNVLAKRHQSNHPMGR